MEIDTSGVKSDIASWREFWEVGVALNGVCIRKGREGFQINIGNRFDLYCHSIPVSDSFLGAKGGLHMELRDNRHLEHNFGFS